MKLAITTVLTVAFVVGALFVDQGTSYAIPEPAPQIPGLPPAPTNPSQFIHSADVIPGASTFTGPLGTGASSLPFGR
jgi:hypothetical protein